MRFREDHPEDLDRARAAVAQWREQNPAGTEGQLLAALGPQFHPDYTPVLRAVLFTHDRKSPQPPPARQEHPGGPQAHPEPADSVRTVTVTETGQHLLHPIPKMTTSELTKLRRALEERLAMDTLPPLSRPREELSKDLADVIAEQDEREDIRRASSRA
ncbi:MAG: hypothetical protein ABSA53_28390 [Streptosporangiaceae bacterium]|jgi:hypothetical protein